MKLIYISLLALVSSHRLQFVNEDNDAFNEKLSDQLSFDVIADHGIYEDTAAHAAFIAKFNEARKPKTLAKKAVKELTTAEKLAEINE